MSCAPEMVPHPYPPPVKNGERETSASERPEIAEPATFVGRGLQPGMASHAEIPEMVMGIDARTGVDRHVSSSLFRRRGIIA